MEIASSTKYSLGIDIGGTKTLLLLTDLDGNAIAQERIPTLVEVDPLLYICKEIKSFLDGSGIERSDIVGTGIGFPATIDFEQSIIVNCPALRISNIHVRTYFQDVCPSPIFVDNDVNMAVIGERWKGGGRGYRDVVLIAIGTGLGSGILLNDKVHRGANGFAGEIGYLQIDPLIEGCKLSADQFGPLESVAAGSGIGAQAQELLPKYPDSLLQGEEVTAEKVFSAAANGDALAQLVIDRTVKYLAFGISNVITLLNPDAVLIGGGVSHSGDFFIDKIRNRVKDLITFPVHIVRATLGGDAGAFGAAAAVLLETHHLTFNV